MSTLENKETKIQRSQSFDTQVRPISPINRHRTVERSSTNKNSQRHRSTSPRKTFSYLTLDHTNLVKLKDHQRQIARQQENDRIYYENRQKLERLAKIAKEPSSYPMVHLEQERVRVAHQLAHRRKMIHYYLPILRENLAIINRLAHVKGAYDVKQMEKDFIRHTHILEQHAENRRKTRDVLLPKIHS